MKRLPRLLSLLTLLSASVSCTINLDYDLSGYEMQQSVLPGVDVAFEKDTIKLNVGDMISPYYGYYGNYNYNVELAKNSILTFTLPLGLFVGFDTDIDNVMLYGRVYNQLPFEFTILPSVDGQPGVFSTIDGPILASLAGETYEQDFEINFDFETPITQIGYLYVTLEGVMKRETNFKFPAEQGSLKVLLQGARLKKGINVNITFI